MLVTVVLEELVALPRRIPYRVGLSTSRAPVIYTDLAILVLFFFFLMTFHASAPLFIPFLPSHRTNEDKQLKLRKHLARLYI